MDQPEEETLPRKIAAEFLLGELIKVSMRQIKTLAMPEISTGRPTINLQEDSDDEIH